MKNYGSVAVFFNLLCHFLQELCRQLRATQGWDSAPVKTAPTQHAAEKEKGLGSGRAPKYSWYEKPIKLTIVP